MNKKILIASIVTLASVAGVVGTVGNAHKVEAANNQTIYFKAPEWWLSDGAGVGVHHWSDGGSGTAWPGDRANKVNGKDNIFSFTLDVESHPNFIFTRIPGSGTISDWGAKTPNLSWSGAGGHNMYDASASGLVWGDPGVSGTWVTYDPNGDPNEKEPADKTLKSLVTPYHNSGFYLRETSINIDMTDDDNFRDLVAAFHAQSTETERTTYFEGNELWMTNANGVNSGYGTEGENMPHFSYANGVKNVDWTVNGTTMESKYTTLLDIKDSISAEQEWEEVADGVFESSNPELLSMFLDFTAPCFLNSKDKNVTNVFTLSHVRIEKNSNNNLELSLYVDSDTSGFIKDGSLLLSKATISKLSYVDVRGAWNSWVAGATQLLTAGQSQNIYKARVNLTAGTHEFKMTENGGWLGNNTTINGTTTNLTFSESQGNCKIKITTAGVYEFSYNISTHKLTVTKI